MHELKSGDAVGTPLDPDAPPGPGRATDSRPELESKERERLLANLAELEAVERGSLRLREWTRQTTITHNGQLALFLSLVFAVRFLELIQSATGSTSPAPRLWVFAIHVVIAAFAFPGLTRRMSRGPRHGEALLDWFALLISFPAAYLPLR